MALTEDTPRAYELGNISEYLVKAATKIYEGAAVGLYGSDGSARGLVAGDIFLGFAEAQADNSAGLIGAINVRVIDHGKIELDVTSVAATDVGASVYATADGTFALTGQEESRVGTVCEFVSAGVAVVKFNALDNVGLGLGS